MLTMSFVYFNIWQIKQTEPRDFENEAVADRGASLPTPCPNTHAFFHDGAYRHSAAQRARSAQ